MATLNFKVEPYALNQINAIVALHNDFKKNHEDRFEAFYYKTANNVNETFKVFLEQKIIDSDFCCLVAINNLNEVIGYISGFIQYRAPIYELQRYGWWSNLFVAPEYRTQGVSEAMYNAIESWFISKNVAFIELSRNAANDYIEQYLVKLGFKNIITHMVKPLQKL